MSMTSAYPQNRGMNGWGGLGTTHAGDGNAWPNQPQPRQPIQQRKSGFDSVTYVQGYNAALAFWVNAGMKVLLIDTLENRIYVKETDPYGVPYPMEAYLVMPDNPAQAAAPVQAEQPAQETAPEWATRAEVEELRAEIAGMKKTEAE